MGDAGIHPPNHPGGNAHYGTAGNVRKDGTGNDPQAAVADVALLQQVQASQPAIVACLRVWRIIRLNHSYNDRNNISNPSREPPPTWLREQVRG